MGIGPTGLAGDSFPQMPPLVMPKELPPFPPAPPKKPLAPPPSSGSFPHLSQLTCTERVLACWEWARTLPPMFVLCPSLALFPMLRTPPTIDWPPNRLLPPLTCAFPMEPKSRDDEPVPPMGIPGFADESLPTAPRARPEKAPCPTAPRLIFEDGPITVPPITPELATLSLPRLPCFKAGTGGPLTEDSDGVEEVDEAFPLG
mmetsp:Transcript_22035/g.44578  ORF Transcript_22035/g.44578 Transcript_22035/m.44578 type:complete len:202 (-) Transcript_22035:293-898(-)